MCRLVFLVLRVFVSLNRGRGRRMHRLTSRQLSHAIYFEDFSPIKSAGIRGSLIYTLLTVQPMSAYSNIQGHLERRFKSPSFRLLPWNFVC